MTLREAREHMDLGTTLGERKPKYKFDWQVDKDANMMFAIRDMNKIKDNMIEHIILGFDKTLSNKFIRGFYERSNKPQEGEFVPIIHDWDIRMFVYKNGNIELQKYNTTFDMVKDQVKDKVIIALSDMPHEYQAFYTKFLLLE